MPGPLKRQRTERVYTRSFRSQGTQTRGPGRGFTRKARARAQNKIVNVPRNKLAFPSNIRTTLRYTEKTIFELAAYDTASIFNFSANNLRDPLTTGAGHQPRGFDEYMALYQAYTVHGATISYHVVPRYSNSAPTFQGTAPMAGINVALHSSGEIPAFPACVVGIFKGVDVLEAGQKIQEITEGDKTKWTILSGSEGSKIVSTSLKVADFHGTTGSLTGREGYWGDLDGANDPTNAVHFSVFAQQLGELPLPTNYHAELVGLVTIEYDVTFSEPKQLAPS
uniref:Capsid protein n=1 Tax=uncultured marine virus TaxID=186617 RepID=S4TDM6_9VIRU|nr:hypothetical protein [uncultured marine virus]